MSATAMIPVSVALLVAVLWSVRWLGQRVRMEPEALRKCVHVALGLYCLTFPIVFDHAWQVAAVCGLAILLLAALRVGRARSAGLGTVLHGVGRDSYGEILFAVSVALLYHLMGLMDGQVILYLLPIATLTLADAAAAIVGSAYGRRLFRIEDGTKSYEGTAIFFLVAWILSTGMLLHFSDAPRENVLILGMTLALFGSMIEAESWRGLDNLFVPVGLYFFLVKYLDASAWDLGHAVAVLVAIIVVASIAVQRLGADAHAARVAVIAFFCIWMNATAVNVASPLVALLAFVHLELRRPSEDRSPYLRAVLAVIGVALFWFTLGAVLGINVILLFHLSFGLIASALAGLALEGRRGLVIGVAALIWGLTGLRLWSGMGPNGAEIAFAALSLAAMLLAALAAPRAAEWLANWRALRAATAGLAGAALFLPVLP